MKITLYRISLLCLLTGLLFSACDNHSNNNHPPFSRTVEIVKKEGRYSFYRNGKPYFVKGAVGNNHLDELAASGGNTIATWDTLLFPSIFADAAKNNIAVIAGLDIPGGDLIAFYQDEKKANELFLSCQHIVRKFKDHPSLLAWSLGNEVLMPFNSNSAPFYKTYNRILQMIHTEDPNHPVSTAIINYQKGSILNINWKIRDLDFISINTYNRLKELPQQLSLLRFIWNGPFLISEWAPNGGWEAKTTIWQAPLENTSTKKAEQYSEFYNNYMPHNNSRFLGSLVFYWGYRHEYTPSWFSIFNEQGIPTEVKESLSDCWMGTATNHSSVKLRHMLIDSMGGQEHIILNAASAHAAKVFIKTDNKDSLCYKWEILNEDWTSWGRTYNNFVKPAPLNNLLIDSTGQTAKFICPKKEGPYRIFVTVYNSKGYCSTANTPFYVVD